MDILLDERLSDGKSDPEHLTERQEELSAVLSALQELPEVDRVALMMHARDEVPYAVIASVLGISLAAVKVRIHRARLKLAQRIKEPEL